MILVVDSGSYKSDWMFQPETAPGDVLLFRGKGINPFFSSEKEIVKVVHQMKDLKPFVEQVSEIYYFGSGCTNPDRREIVSNALCLVFPSAFVSVDNDVIGSAFATCGSQEGLIATLGTGSSISFYDGEQVQPGKQGLGYVLGDAGSGAWLGMRLVTSFLYESMPEDLRQAFDQKYGLQKQLVLEAVYQRKFPNVYLASFAPFLSEHRNHPWVSGLLKKGFTEFVKTNICLYPNYQEYQCHFVGSIAYFFKQELMAVCEEYDVQVGKVIQQPIQDLYHYIISREKMNSPL